MKFRFLALLALVLGLASCQNDFEGDNIVTSAEVDFQLSVAAPELAGTRAGENGADDTLKGFDSTHGAIDYLQTTDVADPDHADWTDVDIRYTLEVYDVATDYTNATPVKDRQVIIKDKYEPVVFTLRLVPKRNYHFVVFADFVANGSAALDATAQLDVTGIRHEIGTTLADIKIIDSQDAINDEVGDAYFATKDIEITNSAAQPIVLQRPYGKLRVVATDLAELNLNVHPKKVVVEYEALNPNKFNAVTGDISGTYSTKVFKTEFVDNVRNNMANHYYNAGYDAMTAEAVNGTVRNTHITLFTDYILAENINGAGVYPQTTKHFTMKVYQGVDETDANLIKSNTFNTEIPIQRNYLTSVVGNILTTATDIKVTIDDNFTNGNTWNPDQDEHDIAAVSTGLEFLKAYYGARNLLLLQDIVVTAADIAAYNDFVANGGGSIFAATRAAQTEETTTTINLNGFTLSFEDDANVVVKEGTTTIVKDDSESEDGSIEVEEDVNNNDKTNGFVVAEGGTLIIESGTIGTGAIENNGTTTIEGGTIESGAIENNGTTNVNNEESVEEDSITNGDEAIVGKYVYTLEELQEAIDAAKDGLNNEVSLAADIVGNATILQKEGVNLIINGQGFKYDGTLYIHGDSRYTGAETLKFTNINFEAETAKYFIDSNSTGSKERYAHNVTIEKCTFTSLAADNSIAVCGPRFRQAYNITIKDCKATNTFFLAWFTGCKNLTIEGCEAINNHEGVTFGPCNNSVIKDSKIDAELFGVRYEPTSDAAYNVTIENCELSGFIPVSVRNIVAGDNKPINVKLVGNNTLTRSEDSLYDVVFAANEYKSGVAPQAPTGEWSYESDKEFVVFGYPVATVGNKEYCTIDEAIANWTNNSTLTLLTNVTLSDVIKLKSTEYHVLDLGIYTLTAASGKNAIEITPEGRSSASYALDIKADATNPGGITATSKVVVRTIGKSGVKDRPIIRFYNGIYNASNIIQHSGSNGTNSPQFIFYNGVYNGSITTNRSINIFEGGTFNGQLWMSVDSSSYTRIGGGKFKYMNNSYGSALNSSKFTIGSAKGVFDRGVYVDDEGYIVVGGPVITDFGTQFKAKATNVSKAGSYLPYSSAAANGLYYTNAEMAIKKHGEANVVLAE